MFALAADSSFYFCMGVISFPSCDLFMDCIEKLIKLIKVWTFAPPWPSINSLCHCFRHWDVYESCLLREKHNAECASMQYASSRDPTSSHCDSHAGVHVKKALMRLFRCYAITCEHGKALVHLHFVPLQFSTWTDKVRREVRWRCTSYESLSFWQTAAALLFTLRNFHGSRLIQGVHARQRWSPCATDAQIKGIDGRGESV